MSKLHKVKSSKEIARGKVFRVLEEEVILPNGLEVKRQIVEHPGAVVILPVDSSGRLIFVKQYRLAIGQYLLELPAGTLEAGEDPLDCAKREIVEEVGQEAANWKELGQLFPAPGFCNELQHCYFASDLRPRPGQLDEDEILEVVSLSLAEVEKAILENQLIDGKSLACFLKAKALKLI